MKEIIGIFVGGLFFPPDKMHKWDEKNLETGGIGGSEVWAIEIANKFVENGYHCMVFADCEHWHYSNKGVEYIPMSNLSLVCNYTRFKCFITSRKTYELSNNINAEKIILMLHDPFVVDNEHYDAMGMKYVDKITYQSDFQRRLVLDRYKDSINENMFFKTFQAIHHELYDNIDENAKKNKMLWSTHKIRGARILIEKILPLIRKEIPDFEIDVCGYVGDMTDEYFKTEGVNVLGNISREELVKRQKESKIWIYPNWGYFENGKINDETFCITAIENAAAKNALILADRTCFSSTLEGYSGFVGTELFEGEDKLNVNKIDEFAKILAEQAIKILKDDNYRLSLANEAYEICKKYTWDGAAETFINEINNKKKEMKETLVLLTGVLRSENLSKILESIKTYILVKNDIHVIWCLCADKYNIHGSLNEIKQECIETQQSFSNFGWCIYPVGLPDNKNYGGLLFNEPLQWIKNNWLKDFEPWVYILDDDNLINPLMGEILPTSLKLANMSNKKVIYFNMLYEDGVYAPICHNTFGQKDSTTGWIPHYLVTDPSQIILKYDFLKEHNFYEGNKDYDIALWKIFSKMDRNEILFPEGWTGDISLNKYQTTHNAITSKEDINKWFNILNDDSKEKTCHLTITTNFDGSKAFMININDMKEIFNKWIKQD